MSDDEYLFAFYYAFRIKNSRTVIDNKEDKLVESTKSNKWGNFLQFSAYQKNLADLVVLADVGPTTVISKALSNKRSKPVQ